MSEFRKRTIDELQDLQTKLYRLEAFIKSKAFFELEIYDRHLLEDQQWVMKKYSSILQIRIARFRPEDKELEGL